MNKNDFFKIHNRIAAKNLEIKEEEVRFEVELGSLNVIKESGYAYRLVDSFRIKLKYFMKKYYLLLVGVLFLFTILYINSYRVSRIQFNTDTPINSSIEQRIKKNFRRLFCFTFSNMNYASFSKSLRMEYAQYPYIEVYSKNNVVRVDIYSYDDEVDKKKDNVVGDIVAKKDGIIDYFYVFSGNSLLSKNKYVKAGDVLISGSLNDMYVSSRGLVMANTYEKATVEVLKKEKVEMESGDSQKFYQIELFKNDFNISKKKKFSACERIEKKTFNFFDVFCVKKIEEREKYDIIRENDRDSAVLIAKEQIEKEFEKNKVNVEEKILNLEEYKIEETEEVYTVTFIIKKLESIGEFQEYKE